MQINIQIYQLPTVFHEAYPVKHMGRLLGLTAIVHWITDHYRLSSNLGVGISEGCFIFEFASLPSEVDRPNEP